MMITNDGIQMSERVVPWCEVREVAIRTTSDGPFAEDLFWLFRAVGDFVEIPGSLLNGEQLGHLQQHLAGFDGLKVIAAMGSTSERVFQLWHLEHSSSVWSEAVYGARFAALVQRLGGQARPSQFERLRDAWSGLQRCYHGLEHLTDCLRELDRARDVQAHDAVTDIAELALWYHDAVYTPGALDNEERSAGLLLEDAASFGLDPSVAQAAAACVRATTHSGGSVEQGSAAELVVDIDLAILGREPLRFMDFEYAIAEEYADVPWTHFVLARGRFLASVLRQPTIFRTPALRERYEQSARRNIAALLASSRYRIHRLLGGVYRMLWRTKPTSARERP